MQRDITDLYITLLRYMKGILDRILRIVRITLELFLDRTRRQRSIRPSKDKVPLCVEGLLPFSSRKSTLDTMGDLFPTD